jgi:hypothetical protein
MTSRTVLWLGLLGTGCTPGPDQPGAFQGTAVALQAHVIEPPAEAVSIELLMDAVPYCVPATLDPGGPPVSQIVDSGGHGGPKPFDPGAPSTRVTFSGGTPAACSNDSPPALRFFVPRVVFGTSRGTQADGIWVARDQHLAYAGGESTFSPFGATLAPVRLPAGYSLLRRTCQAPQTVSAEPVDQLVEFRHLTGTAGRSTAHRDPRAELEQQERSFLESCGVRAPREDLGARVSLDWATRLAWSPDGGTLYYLVASRERHIVPTHDLRSTPVASGPPVELVTDISGKALEAPGSGDVYVQTIEGSGLRGHLSGAERKFEPVPGTTVSPDGAWIVFNDQEPRLFVLEVQTGVTHLVDLGFGGAWSPDSRHLAYTQTSPMPSRSQSVGVWSTETRSTIALLPGSGGRTTWLPDGRLLTSIDSSLVTLFSADLNARLELRFPPAPGPGGQGFLAPLFAHIWVGDRLVRVAAFEPWNVAEVQVKFGVTSLGGTVVGLAMQEPNTNTIEMMLPPDTLPIEVQPVGGTRNAVLVWSRKCLGLYETVCSFRLHQFSLPDGQERIVATSDEPVVMALSPDHRKVAISNSRGIFIKDLPADPP